MPYSDPEKKRAYQKDYNKNRRIQPKPEKVKLDSLNDASDLIPVVVFSINEVLKVKMPAD
jgi:hypothetical protein